MAENSEIAWTDHTVNFWWGCAKVSPACTNCYAEGLDARFAASEAMGGVKGHWGVDASRRVRVEAARREAFKYERRAVKEGVTFKVFTNSMADFFEVRPDLEEARLEALDVMRLTPHLNWLVLTKRADKIYEMLQVAAKTASEGANQGLATWLQEWLNGNPPANVWLGTTLENQEWANKRVAWLLQVPAAIHFLSAEPLLGPVSLVGLPGLPTDDEDVLIDALAGKWYTGPRDEEGKPMTRLDWVIVGGESGPKARPMKIEWAEALQAECAAAGVAFFFKQLSQASSKDFRGFDAFPESIRIREFPLQSVS